MLRADGAGECDRGRDVPCCLRLPHLFPQQHIKSRAGKCLTEERRNHRRRDGRLGAQRTAREHVDDLLQLLKASDSGDKTLNGGLWCAVCLE